MVAPLIFNDNDALEIRTHKGYGYYVWCMENGFALKGNDSATDGVLPLGKLEYGNGNSVWEAGQWGSRYDLTEGTQTITDKVALVKDAAKKLQVNRTNNLLTLEVRGSLEYDEMKENIEKAQKIFPCSPRRLYQSDRGRFLLHHRRRKIRRCWRIRLRKIHPWTCYPPALSPDQRCLHLLRTHF